METMTIVSVIAKANMMNMCEMYAQRICEYGYRMDRLRCYGKKTRNEELQFSTVSMVWTLFFL